VTDGEHGGAHGSMRQISRREGACGRRQALRSSRHGTAKLAAQRGMRHMAGRITTHGTTQ
jgi:hypothetical protein